MNLCESWDVDLDCCDLPDDVDADLLDRWTAVSSRILFDASGRRWGLCEVTVRPCLRRCDGGSGALSPFIPYKGGDGEWRNFATCGCVGDCSCVALCEVVLDGPVDSIVSVLIDGDELMPESYRLDLVGTQYRLLRTDGGCWPSCSDIAASCEDEGAFCVTYMQGIALDELAIAANSELACELTKACIPGCECRLPSNVASLVRRGVGQTFDTAKAWIRTLPMVDAFLDVTNPHGLGSSSTVFSPDRPQARTTVTAEGS